MRLSVSFQGIATITLVLCAGTGRLPAFAATECAHPDLLSPGRPIIDSYNPVDARGPALAWSGGQFAFAEGREIGSSAQQVFIQRLGADGTSLGPPNPVGVVPSNGFALHPHLVGDGTGFGILWRDGGANVLKLARTDAAGSLLGTVAIAPSGVWSPGDLAWSGSEYLIAWVEDSARIRLARVGAGGALVGAPVIVASGAVASPSLAAHGTTVGIAWKSPGPAPNSSSVWFRILDVDGTPLSSIVNVSGSGNALNPRIQWVGDGYVVVWVEDFKILARKISASGILGGGATLLTQGSGWRETFGLGWSGADLLVTWVESIPPYELYGRRIMPDATPGGEARRLTWNRNDYSAAGAIAWNGERYGMTWVRVDGAPMQAMFGLVGCDCLDDDGDSFTTCRGDCDDTQSGIRPDAVDQCDGIDNDCDGSVDDGLDYPRFCGVGACRRTVANCAGGSIQPCVPGSPSPEICNGIDDDCDDAVDDGLDADQDGTADCFDCGPGDPAIHPGAAEICNAVDDDCDGVIDERSGVVDQDGDGVREACDNCPALSNPAQTDTDSDGLGDVCDNCPSASNPSQADTDGDGTADACDLCPLSPYPTTDSDADGLGADCDNCPLVANPGQVNSDFDAFGDACDRCPGLVTPFNDDTDADTLGDACDNCPTLSNLDQGDADADGEGDACDLNDGRLMVWVSAPDQVEWDAEPTFFFYDVYRGDIDVLKATGQSTQDPATVPLAGQFCGMTDSFLLDEPPPPGKGVFYLVAVTTNSGYVGIGDDSAGNPRLNAHPCP